MDPETGAGIIENPMLKVGDIVKSSSASATFDGDRVRADDRDIASTCSAGHLDSGFSGFARCPKHCSRAYSQAENGGSGMPGSLVTMNGSGPKAT